MKITKRQLRRIIKEEKAKLLSESFAEVTADAGFGVDDMGGLDSLRKFPELAGTFAALDAGEVPPEVKDPNSLFRRLWRLVGEFEAESDLRFYGFEVVEEWFDTGEIRREDEW